MADRDDPETLQRRFAALVVSGTADPTLLAGPDADGRAAIYRHMYRARLHGVLSTDLPVLRAVLGDGRFSRVCDAYLAACPPRSFTLRDLADRMPAFLATGACSDAPAWASELAQLEWTRAAVFDAGDVAVLTVDDVQACADIAALPLRLVTASVLLELHWNVDDIWSSVRDGETAAAAFGARAVLVWRRDVSVVHRTLEPDEAAAIRRIADGATFAEVCETIAGDTGNDADAAPQRAAALLLRWIQAEILAR